MGRYYATLGTFPPPPPPLMISGGIGRSTAARWAARAGALFWVSVLCLHVYLVMVLVLELAWWGQFAEALGATAPAECGAGNVFACAFADHSAGLLDAAGAVVLLGEAGLAAATVADAAVHVGNAAAIRNTLMSARAVLMSVAPPEMPLPRVAARWAFAGMWEGALSALAVGAGGVLAAIGYSAPGIAVLLGGLLGVHYTVSRYIGTARGFIRTQVAEVESLHEEAVRTWCHAGRAEDCKRFMLHSVTFYAPLMVGVRSLLDLDVA